jgi:hypothetical protein
MFKILFNGLFGILLLCSLSNCRPIYAPAAMTEATNFMATPFPHADSTCKQHYISGNYGQGFRYLSGDFNHLLMAQYHRGITKAKKNDNFTSTSYGGYAYGGIYEIKDSYFSGNRAIWLDGYSYFGVGGRFSHSVVVLINPSLYFSPAGYMATLGYEFGNYNEFTHNANHQGVVSNWSSNFILNNSYTFGLGCKIGKDWQLDFQNALSLYYFVLPTYAVNANIRYKSLNTWAGIHTLGFSPAWRLGVSYSW